MTDYIDDMAKEMTDDILKRNKKLREEFSYQEVLLGTKILLGAIEKMVSKWVSDFMKKELPKED